MAMAARVADKGLPDKERERSERAVNPHMGVSYLCTGNRVPVYLCTEYTPFTRYREGYLLSISKF